MNSLMSRSLYFRRKPMNAQEKIESTKGIIRSRKWKDEKILWPKDKKMIYKTLHRKLNIEQH